MPRASMPGLHRFACTHSGRINNIHIVAVARADMLGKCKYFPPNTEYNITHYYLDCFIVRSKDFY